MKRITILLIIAAISTTMFAQHFGLKGGGSLSQMVIRTDTVSYNTQLKPGFIAGLAFEYPLKNTMALHTSVNFKSIGTWIHQDLDLTAWRVNYIDLDIVYEYIFKLEKMEIFVQGGGYAAYALYGKEVYKPENGDTETTDLKIGTETEDVIKPFDVGVIVGAGVYFGKVRLSASFQPGLIDISNVDDWIIWNRVGELSFTYLFNRN